MKNFADAFFASMLGLGVLTSPVEAQTQNLNPNAVAEALNRAVELHTTGRPGKTQPYVDARSGTMVCVGKIPQEPITVLAGDKEPYFNEPSKLKIVEIAQDLNAPDKAAQKKAQDLLTRSNIVHMEFTTSINPDKAQFDKYFTDKFGKAPLDVGKYGTSIRSLTTTTITLDKAVFDKFLAAEKDLITKYDTAYKTEIARSKAYPAFWSVCGPAK